MNKYIELKASPVHGRGIFSKTMIPKNTVIEVCPSLEMKGYEIQGRLKDYVFRSLNKGHSLVVFGYGSIYNHSDTPNLTWIINKQLEMVITTNQDIPENTELFVSYGANWWNSRSKSNATPNATPKVIRCPANLSFRQYQYLMKQRWLRR